jgi:Rps23 Pro-64 3,4-dihydroxylase Tpa1-like proline 4-hydroxylase
MSDRKVVVNKEEIAPGIIVYSDVIFNHNEILYNLKEATEDGTVISWGPPRIVRNGEPVVDYSVRNVDVIGITFELSKEILLDPKDPTESFKNKLGNILYTSLQPSIDDYKSVYGIGTNGTHLEGWQDSYQLLRYGKNNFFNNHFDDSVRHHRRISIVYYFNDDYVGGEITFNRFGINHKPKANQLIVFPSTYVYNHSVKEVTEGTRYALVTWLR